MPLKIFQFLQLLLTFVPGIIARPSRSLLATRDEPSKFRLASIGDSWAAGPAVSARDAYGGPDNWNSCARHAAAWEVLLAEDTSWTDNQIEFAFVACSGATLVDATESEDPQMAHVGSPHILTMQLGGNNAHFSDIARACLYIGDAPFTQRDYPDPKGTCFQVVSRWETYLRSNDETGSFYKDHHDTLNSIMTSSLTWKNNDFYLYVVGYAEFFNTSPGSDWCNDKSFGVVLHPPKLNNALRAKLNELVALINEVTAKSVKDMQNSRVRWFDPSSLFENHRFCEPQHTLNNQYFLNDVWFWNLSDPADDPNYLTAENAEQAQSDWANDHMFFNGTVATEAQLLRMLDGPEGSNPYSGGRTFHPKEGGHQAITTALINRIRLDHVPGVKQAPPEPSPPKKQPYETGPIHIHVNEFWGCLDDEDNLSVEIIMYDSTSNQIGYLKRTQAGASAAARMGSRLEDFLIISPQWAKGGYIQFQLGELLFNTNDDRDEGSPVFCRWGGFDPREGPTCVIEGPIYFPDAVAINQIDCWFPSPVWKGGKPSDGSLLQVLT